MPSDYLNVQHYSKFLYFVLGSTYTAMYSITDNLTFKHHDNVVTDLE